MKKKIGIMTFLKVNNYGAELQAFALQEKLNCLGFDAEIIDYLFYKHKNFKFTKRAKPFLKLSFVIRLKEILYPLLSEFKALPYRKEKKEREIKFDLFHKRYTRLSKTTLNSMDKLYNKKFDYDIFMTGSDQVWNPYTNVSLLPYFLDFVHDNKVKISYASSFGVSEIPDEVKKIYKDCLIKYDHIAVREKQGVKLVNELTGRDAVHVLDPTLLMDEKEWEQFSIKPDIEKPYILLYVLTESPYITELAKHLAGELGWNIVRICKNAAKKEADSHIENIIDAGPGEFLGLFQKASFVLTNSFHGTAFSVNFSRPFYTILPKNKPNNSRQQNFLESFDLQDRLINEGDPLPEPPQYFFPYEAVADKLKEKRKDSINYLKDTLND